MEKEVVSKLVVALFIGGSVGFLTASTTTGSGAAQSVLDDYPVDLSRSGMHTHDQRNVPESEAPSVNLEVEEDPMMAGNYILNIQTENFEFAPNSVSSDHVLGEGHAHVFVNDVKISRAFGSYYHLPKLKPGTHTIMVTLNTNEHEEYAVNGESISDSTTVEFQP